MSTRYARFVGLNPFLELSSSWLFLSTLEFLYFVPYVLSVLCLSVLHNTGFWSAWLFQKTEDLSNQRGKGKISSHLEMFDILKMLLLLQSTGVGFASCHRCC